MTGDTPSVRVQLIRNTESAFNRAMDEQAQQNPPIKVRVEVSKDRVRIVMIETDPQPEVLWQPPDEVDDDRA